MRLRTSARQQSQSIRERHHGDLIEPPGVQLREATVDQPASPIQGLPATMRSRMRIDTYGKPDGWTVTLQASIDGELWQRSIDCGTDSSRNAEWQAVTD